MMKHYFEECFLAYVNYIILVIAKLNLWMSQGAHDTFVLVINFLILNEELKHVIIGLFEAKGTIGVGLGNQW
jgi:hypothetical protein